MSAARVRVLIATPDNVVASLLTRCLAGAEFSVTTSCDQDELLAQVAATGPHVLIAGPGNRHDLLLVAIPRGLASGTRTLIVSDRPLDDRGSQLLLAGASGFLLAEQASMAELQSAVRAVASGDSALHPAVVQAVLERWRAGKASDADSAEFRAPPAELTAREREVLQGLRDGLTNRQIAARLGVAEKTVEAHKARLYAKLGARNQAHAVRIASERGVET